MKGKGEKLHNLLVGEHVRTFNKLLQHAAMAAKPVCPFSAVQMAELCLSDLDFILVIFLQVFCLV